MSLADRFKRAPTHGGARLPIAGMAPTPIELYKAGPLGPCAATVVADAIRLESGAQRFRIVETWTPPEDGFGEITETTLVDDALEATSAAKRAADEWRQGSARSARLAPGGRLRAPAAKPGPGTMRAVGAFELAPHPDRLA